jgi:hypothetical protein
MGQDLARLHDHSALVLLSVEPQKVRIIGAKLWEHLDYRIVIEDTRRIYYSEQVELLGVDASGPGLPVLEQYRGMRIEPVNFTHRSKNEMFQFQRYCIESGILSYPRPDNPTMIELLTQIKEQELKPSISTSEIPRYDHPSGRHDDLLQALNIALYVSRPYIEGFDAHIIGIKPSQGIYARKPWDIGGRRHSC